MSEFFLNVKKRTQFKHLVLDVWHTAPTVVQMEYALHLIYVYVTSVLLKIAALKEVSIVYLDNKIQPNDVNAR